MQAIAMQARSWILHPIYWLLIINYCYYVFSFTAFNGQIKNVNDVITSSNKSLTLFHLNSLVLAANVYKRPRSTTTVASS